MSPVISNFWTKKNSSVFGLFKSSEWILIMSWYIQVRNHPYTYTYMDDFPSKSN